MNALNRDIQPGEIVILKREGRFAEIRGHERVFICDAGPGLLASSRHTRIVGRFRSDNYETEISGMEIAVGLRSNIVIQWDDRDLKNALATIWPGPTKP
jgi:hypothetical protein